MCAPPPPSQSIFFNMQSTSTGMGEPESACVSSVNEAAQPLLGEFVCSVSPIRAPQILDVQERTQYFFLMFLETF